MHFRQRLFELSAVGSLFAVFASAQMIDNTQAQPTLKAGINKSLQAEIGAGRGDVNTPGSSIFIINRDPFRSIRRGRQLFQRKFTHLQGQGPNEQDGTADSNGTIDTNNALGAGLADSCAMCHGRPRGSAGAGGDVATRPDSRDAPHLFGLGIKEMLADEITTDLRAIRDSALLEAAQKHRSSKRRLISKGINFVFITANPDGSTDASQIAGIDADLRVKPFFAEGSTISMREFIVGALHKEVGLEASSDPDLIAAQTGRVVTPSGMVLDGTKDKISAPPAPDLAIGNEVDPALVDHLEFYLLNYFKPGHYIQNAATTRGRQIFAAIGCESCHVDNLTVNHDRRVADLDTVYDSTRGIFNNLFATAAPLFQVVPDATAYPPLKVAAGNPFTATDIYPISNATISDQVSTSAIGMALSRNNSSLARYGASDPPDHTATMGAA